MKTSTRAASIFAFSLALLTVQSAFAFYNPQVGRWANRDPLQEDGGMNLYAYVLNDPISQVDPLGLTGEGKGLDDQSSKNQLDKCGDCTPKRHAALQGAVNAACKTGKRACKANQDLATLKANLAKNRACAAARDAINNECYEGGDPGHQQAANEARNAAATCDKLIKQKEGNPQPPNPRPPPN